MGINTVSLCGRLGQDPSIKYFESGSCKVSVSLAVDTGKDQTSWFRLEFWNKAAETIQQYATKGKELAVEASLSFDSWTDKSTGELRNMPVFRVNNFKFVGGRSGQQQQQQYQQQYQQPPAQQQYQQPPVQQQYASQYP